MLRDGSNLQKVALPLTNGETGPGGIMSLFGVQKIVVLDVKMSSRVWRSRVETGRDKLEAQSPSKTGEWAERESRP